jgi:hypothetical protein
MRNLLALILLPFWVVAAGHAGELPREPIVQLLIRGESAPVDAGDDYLFGLPEMALADQAASAGGKVWDEGKGDFSFSCVADGARSVWFLSDASSDEGEPLLTAVIISALPVVSRTCDPLLEVEAVPMDTQLPGIGADEAEIQARFGPVELSGEGLVAFRSHDELGDGGDSWELIKTVTYHVTDGVVDAVAYEQVTVH